MSKLSKIVILFIVTLLCCVPIFVQATNVDMNLTNPNNSLADNTTNDANTNSSTNPVTESLTPQSNYSNPTTTINNQNDASADLGIANILNIILIVIGVLLILLGIAVIIRLKH